MSLLDEVDRLYEGCATEPDRWSEQAFADWADGVAQGHTVDREVARSVRRCLTAGRRLATFWRGAEESADAGDWRQRVDIALGSRAWRPQLELAMALLARSPDAETFDRAGELFAVVNHQPFLDGIGYDEWLQEHRR